MAQPKIGVKVALDGEKEYKAALAEINSGLKVLKSELNLASEQFKNNANSVEALTQKNDVLDRSILTQQEKIDKLKEALQFAGQEFGESSTKTDYWKVALNNAEAELEKMRGELEASTDALKKVTSPLDKVKNALAATKEEGGGVKSVLSHLKEQFTLNTDAAKGLGTKLTDIAGQFGVQLPEGAKKAAEALNGINAGAALAVTGVGLLAAAVVKTVKALADMTKKSAEYAKEVKTLASVTSQSTDDLQRLDYAAERLEVSSDRVHDSLKELTNKMQEANNGSEEVAGNFARLGVEITDVDGNLRSAHDVFLDTIDALGNIENRTDRDALAMDLMSESAQQLNPMIDAGREVLEDYCVAAEAAGAVLSGEMLDSLSEVDEAQNRLLETQEAVTRQISAEFAPYMAEALGNTANFVREIGIALRESGVVDSFGSILQSAMSLLEPLGELASIILPLVAQALKPVSEAVALIADAANIVVGVLTLDGDRIKTALGMNVGEGKLSASQRASGQYNDYRYSTSAGWIEKGTYTDAELRAMYAKAEANGTAQGTFEWWKETQQYLKQNASGTDYFYGGRTLVGENGPEELVLPRGSQITSASETRYRGVKSVYVDKIIIDAKNVKEFNDVVRIMMNERISSRMEAK